MASNQERTHIALWNKAGMILFMVAAVAVLVWAISMWEAVPPRVTPPAPQPPPVETTLHDAGDGVTCWVLRRGSEILGSGCLR